MRFAGKLSHQLLILIVFIFAVVLLMLGIVLPQVVLPIIEKNIYNYLREPLEFVQSDIDEDLITTEIAYLYQIGDTVAYSDNIHDISQRIMENLFTNTKPIIITHSIIIMLPKLL